MDLFVFAADEHGFGKRKPPEGGGRVTRFRFVVSVESDDHVIS